MKIGRRTGGVLVTGGEDRKVNMWAVGKPHAILSLAGHQSAVESVCFDDREEVVLSGAAGGTVKVFDLEHAKVVRTLSGHRAHCVALDYHPYGEFFVSGSADCNLKVWDLRQKACIHTYKGHARDLTTVRFSPDGRWVASGSQDGCVKVWDLAAGKLLHSTAEHTHAISGIEFHPSEYLLATASADRTVKFWDLDPFGLIETAGPEATGVRAIAFVGDGALASATQDGLKTWTWEPAAVNDHVDPGWSKVADLSLRDDKLLGCAFHSSFVGLYVVNLPKLEPFASGRARLPEARATDADAAAAARPQVRVEPARRAVPGPAARDPEKENHGPPEAGKPGAPAVGDSLPLAASVHWQAVEEPAAVEETGAEAVEGEPGRPGEAGVADEGAGEGPGGAGTEDKDADAGGDGSLGDSWRQFVPPVARVPPPAPPRRDPFHPEKGDEEEMASMMAKHPVMLEILRARVANLTSLRTLWDQGRATEAFKVLGDLGDSSLAADALPSMLRAKEAVKLEGAAALGPLIAAMAEQGPHDTWVCVALEAGCALHGLFGGLVASTCGAPATSMIDLEFEARLAKCRALRDAFDRLRARAQVLKTHGNAAVAAGAEAVLLGWGVEGG